MTGLAACPVRPSAAHWRVRDREPRLRPMKVKDYSGGPVIDLVPAAEPARPEALRIPPPRSWPRLPGPVVAVALAVLAGLAVPLLVNRAAPSKPNAGAGATRPVTEMRSAAGQTPPRAGVEQAAIDVLGRIGSPGLLPLDAKDWPVSPPPDQLRGSLSEEPAPDLSGAWSDVFSVMCAFNRLCSGPNCVCLPDGRESTLKTWCEKYPDDAFGCPAP